MPGDLGVLTTLIGPAGTAIIVAAWWIRNEMKEKRRTMSPDECAAVQAVMDRLERMERQLGKIESRITDEVHYLRQRIDEHIAGHADD